MTDRSRLIGSLCDHVSRFAHEAGFLFSALHRGAYDAETRESLLIGLDDLAGKIRACVDGGVDEIVRVTTGTKPGEWTTELLMLSSSVCNGLKTLARNISKPLAFWDDTDGYNYRPILERTRSQLKELDEQAAFLGHLDFKAAIAAEARQQDHVPRGAAIGFPDERTLRAIADTSLELADVIVKSVVTDDPVNSILAKHANDLPVLRVIAKLESHLYVDRPSLEVVAEKVADRNVQWLTQEWPAGWLDRDDVKVSARRLWGTLAGLFVYFGRDPLSLGTWDKIDGKYVRRVMEHVEHPPVRTDVIGDDGRVRSTDEGLSTKWLDQLRQYANELRIALGEAKSMNSSERPPKTKASGGEKPPPKRVRRLNVEKVQGSERCFKIDRKPIKLSPACANLLNGLAALNESNTPATPANLMAKLSPRYDSDRKRFEDDKGRFNDALKAAGIAKGLYVVGDVFQLCKPRKKTPAKAVKKNGMKTVRRR